MYESRGVLSAGEKRGFGEGGIELCARALMRIRTPKGCGTFGSVPEHGWDEAR